MFTTKYNVYDVNVYDLLKRGGGNKFYEYQNEYHQPEYDFQNESFVSVDNSEQTPKKTPQTPSNINQMLKQSLDQKTSEIESLKRNQEQFEKQKYKEGLKKGYKAGLEGGKLYGLAMATTPIISRDLDKIQKESTKEKIKENTDAFLDIENKLMMPLFGNKDDNPFEIDALDVAQNIYVKHREGNDILDKHYYSDTRKDLIESSEKAIEILETDIGNLEKEIKQIKKNKGSPNKKNLGTKGEQLNKVKEQLKIEENTLLKLYNPVENKIKEDIINNRRNPVDRILGGIPIGQKSTLYPSFQLSLNTNPEITQQKILNEIKTRVERFKNEYNNL